MNLHSQYKRGKYIALSVGIIFCIFLLDTVSRGYAQTQRKNEILKDENFRRPSPSRPIQPEIPGANRYQEDKVFLEYADSLYKVTNRFDTIEKQILKGNVKFRQAGMWMFCDSAYYYPEANSLDAFSNVRMEQGDTLFVYADKVFYNGNARMAYLKNGPSRSKVTLINKDVTLTTDSLDYNLNIELGWYSRWGTIDDKVNTLTSLYGEYSPATKRAEFYTDVELVNNRDGFIMLTDTLHYNTETHIADIDSRTEIRGENDTIFTSLATYYTDSGDADLLSRSLIIHRDSTGNVTTLEGDSIIYDNATRISRVYMFKDPFKRSYPMVLTDTAQKTTLIGGFGLYNDSTKEAFATIYPLLMEYSQGDTLFLRADTIRTFLITEKVPSNKRKIKTKSGYPESNGKPIVIVDSGRIWIDTVYFTVNPPYADYPIRMLDAILPKQDKKEINYKTVSGLQPDDEALEESLEETIEKSSDVIAQGIKETAFLPDSTLISENVSVIDSISNPVMPIDSVDTNQELILENNVDLGSQDIDSIQMQYHVALAYHRGRFFKKDMQGVADSLMFVERDSMLYLIRKPIVWSGERQVTGNRIDVHFNDSTADWAYLPESGLISEYIDEDFYNQITGKEIKAFFEGQELRKLYVSGNVETIFLPQESDSTYNRMVTAESSYLELYVKDNQMEELKMWPEVSGTVSPLFQVKKSQQYLRNFRWWGFLRPQREWYGNEVRWADNLGEVPDELEQYFLTPSEFGEPKSFPSQRFVLPESSLETIMALENEATAFSEILPDSVSAGIQPLDSINNKILPGDIKADEKLTTGEIEKSAEEEVKAEEEFNEELQKTQKIEEAAKKEEETKLKTDDE